MISANRRANRTVNAALFAISLLANNDAALAQKLDDFRKNQRDMVLDMTLPPSE